MADRDLGTLIGNSERPCVIVAHPDDEALWCAGLVIRYPGDWLIVCCTIPHADPERIGKFRNACEELGAKPHQLNHPERSGEIPLAHLNLNDRDLIVTHNAQGEYGHVQHKEVHHKIKARYPDALCFGYGSPTSNLRLELTDAEWQRKLQAIKCYDHTSSTDQGKPKWQALLDYYGKKYDLRRETYV